MTETQPDRPPHPLRRAIDYFTKDMARVRGFLTAGSALGFLTLLEVQLRDGIRGPIAEIGTYHGKSLIGFGLGAPQDRLVGVDLFRSDNGTDFEPELRANWRSFGLSEDGLQLHRGSSTALDAAAWGGLLGAPARLVHVDGEHTRPAALHDLRLAASSLAEGGVIVADDVLHPWFPDVTLGIADFLDAAPDMTAFALFDREAALMQGGAKLMIARRTDAPRYVEALRFAMPANVTFLAQFAGSNPVVLGFSGQTQKRLLPLSPG
jgi:predicted O-methyltransferase YrrM